MVFFLQNSQNKTCNSYSFIIHLDMNEKQPWGLILLALAIVMIILWKC